MQIVLGLVIALFLVTAILLALLRAGIRRQERATSLASQSRGLSAAVARRVLGLYASTPAGPASSGAADCPDQRTTDGKKACRS